MNELRYRYVAIEEDRAVRFREAVLKEVPPHRVLIRVIYCGICATDVAIAEGLRAKTLPYLPGHEYVGTVEAVGAMVDGLRPGDQVVGNPNYVCETCYFCSQGEYNLCNSADELHYSNGAFAEYLTIDSRYVYRTPPTLSARDAALTECLACALHAVAQLSTRRQKLALVIGAGTMGLLVTEVIRENQLADVIVVSETMSARRQTAQRVGADIVVQGDPDEVCRAVRSAAPLGADAVVDCAGSVPALCTALAIARRGGRVVLVGRTPEDAAMEINPCSLARRSLSLIGSSRYVPQEFEQALSWLGRGAIRTREYFDRVFDLTDLENALDHVKQRKGIKTLVAARSL